MKEKINKKNISILLCFFAIGTFIVLGNCLTFNIGNRAPIKVAEIIALLCSIILIIINGKEILKFNKDIIKILGWFIIASIPLLLYNYPLKNIAYGLLYSIRIIYILAVSIIFSNTLKKYEVKLETICKFIINSYLVVCIIGFLQLIFFPKANDFYKIFTNIGIYLQSPDPHEARLISTYFDPNFLAACLIIPMILSLHYFTKENKVSYIIKFIIFIVTIILTVSRSGVAGLVLSLIIYAILSIYKNQDKKIRINLKVLAISATVCIVFTGLTLFSNIRVFKRILNSASDESTYARVEDWSNGIDSLGNSEEESNNHANKVNPIYGIGYNMIGFNSVNASKTDTASFGNDSSLLLIAISSGGVGTAYFIYIILDRIIRAFKHKDGQNLYKPMIAIVVTSLAICNFNNLLFYVLWLFPIFILINVDEYEIKSISD